MKEQLLKLIDQMEEYQITYAFAFLSKMFGKGGANHG